MGRHLVDTNVLLRWAQPDHPQYGVSRVAIEAIGAEHELCVGSQNLAEFWNVATRPRDRNGFGLNCEEAEKTLTDLEAFFTLLPDDAAAYPRWRSLVVSQRVQGAKVHDARLVALMMVHGVAHILTFNDSDFVRYPQITAVHPGAVTAVERNEE